MKKLRIIGALVLAFLVGGGCTRIEPFSVQAPGLFPEGLEYDASRGAFLITSLTEGKVHAVKAGGEPELLIDDADLVSAIGIRVDTKRNLLFVCSSDPGVSKKTAPETRKQLAGLAVYDLKSVAQKEFVRLDALNAGAPSFCNDIALAPNGNIFVTNSFSPIVYRVDSRFHASIVLNAPELAAKGFGLNGIVALDDGTLLVAHSANGALYRVDVAAGTATAVELSEAMPNADGLVQLDANRVAIAQNMDHLIAIYETTDGWQSAKRTGVFPEGFSFPTTGVQVDGRLFYLNGKLHELFSGNREIAEFEIREIAVK